MLLTVFGRLGRFGIFRVSIKRKSTLAPELVVKLVGALRVPAMRLKNNRSQPLLVVG